MTMARKFSQGYKVLALHVLNTLVFLTVVNVGLWGFFKIRDGSSPSNPIFSINRDYSNLSPSNLKRVYPDLSKEAIDKLLKETWSRPIVYETFTQFKESPYRGDYVNVDENGFRIGKNQGPWPPEPNKLNIFLFGGSTTFGYGVPDDQTIASYLQQLLSDKLGREVRVYNFGRGFYYSTQERILLEKLLSAGFLPDLAVFVDGYNDFMYRFRDEPLFTSELKSLVMNNKTEISLLNNLPLTRLIAYLKRIASPTLEKQQEHKDGSRQPGNSNGRKTNPSAALSSKEETYDDKSIVAYVVNRYLTNKKLIEAVTTVYGVRSVFVWQPIAPYKYDLNYHLLAGDGFDNLYSTGYRYMEELIKKKPLGDNFLWCADMQERLQEPLYVDRVHYSAKMSEMLAAAIANFLLERNIL
jgi:lysophospholipase L1-like esterase